MGLNYDLGDKSLKRMNHFEKLDKANKSFFCRKCKIFRKICAYFYYIKSLLGLGDTTSSKTEVKLPGFL